MPRPTQRPTNFLFCGYQGSFPEVKRPERGAGHSHLRNVNFINEWNCTSTRSYSFTVWTGTISDFTLQSTCSLIAFDAATPLATHPHLHCTHRLKRFSCRTCSGRVSITKCGSFPQYQKYFGSVIGPREVEGNLKYTKPLYINNIIYMYSVEHNNVFIVLVATSFGRYDQHQANAMQNLQRLVTYSA